MSHSVRRTSRLLLALAIGVALAQNAGPACAWRGAIETPGQALGVSVTLEQSDDAWRGAIDIPAQGARDVPLEAIAVEETLLPIGTAGAHGSTARDMVRYMATLLRGGVTPDGVRVVDEDSLRETWETQVPVSATESYGPGWIVGKYKGLDRFHTPTRRSATWSWR